MDVFAVLLRSTRRLKMLLKSRSNTWQPSTTQHKNTHISSYLFPWLDCPLPSCDMFQVWTLRPHIVRWKMSTFRTHMAMATSVQAFKIVFNFELLYDLFYKLSKCADRKRNSKKRGQRTTLYNCSGHPGPGLIFSPKLVPDFRVPLKSGHDLFDPVCWIPQ